MSVRLTINMAGLNCHFVSRFLTTPWEYGQRHLWYYDFASDEVRSSSSRSLFAVGGANTSEVEARLNQVIETPISMGVARLVNSNDSSGLTGLDKKRAVVRC